MALRVSRETAARFLVPYVADLEIYPKAPFESIDRAGVGALMRTASDIGSVGQPEAQDRHLRRARRRPVLDRLLS